MDNPNAITQWLLDNPGQWFRVCEELTSRNLDYANQITNILTDLVYDYSQDRGEAA